MESKQHLTWSNFLNTHGITSKHFKASDLLESRLKIFQILKPLGDLCSNLSILVVYWSFFVGAAVLLQNSLIITIYLLRQATSQLMWDFLAKAAKRGTCSWWQIWPSKPQQGNQYIILYFHISTGYIGMYDPNRFFPKMYIDVLETHL